MNREIKFRAWNLFEKCFYTKPFLVAYTGCPFVYNEEFLHTEDFDAVNPSMGLVIQQYTEMKDINDKEIYERDIIQLENSPYLYEVVWDTWRWGIDSKGKVTDFIQGFTNAVEDRAIVVGNIFENPELLN